MGSSLVATASREKLAPMINRVITLGQNLVKPSLNFKPMAQAHSRRPDKTSKNHDIGNILL